MGAHFALYAATELNIKFAGIILHNWATLSKKSKVNKEDLIVLSTYIPKLNLQRAEKLRIPSIILHTAKAEKLDSSHSERLRDKIIGFVISKYLD